MDPVGSIFSRRGFTLPHGDETFEKSSIMGVTNYDTRFCSGDLSEMVFAPGMRVRGNKFPNEPTLKDVISLERDRSAARPIIQRQDLSRRGQPCIEAKHSDAVFSGLSRKVCLVVTKVLVWFGHPYLQVSASEGATRLVI